MSQTATPVADDIAFVRSLPADRQSAVLSALLVEFAARQPKPAPIPVETVDGQLLGKFHPEKRRMAFEVALRGLTPDARKHFLRPLPPDFDPDDSLTIEELAALRSEAVPQAKR